MKKQKKPCRGHRGWKGKRQDPTLGFPATALCLAQVVYTALSNSEIVFHTMRNLGVLTQFVQ
jgi:hypothetical protein